MIVDATRWILVEAWLALGLRLEWCRYYDSRSIPEKEWQEDEDRRRYYYAGHGIWRVLEGDRPTTGLGFPMPRCPQLHADTMKHELAHYLAASPQDREKLNFDIGQRAEPEERALEAEAVIDALLQGCARIVAQALAPRRAS